MSKHTYITYSELTGQKFSENDLNTLLTSLSRESTFIHLSMINNFLALFPLDFDEEKYVYIQNFLAFNLFDSETLEKLRTFTERISLVDRPIFHRQQVLLLMKKVLLQASPNGELNPNDSRDAKNVIGKLLLIISDFTVTDEQELRTKSEKPNSDEETDRVLSELLAQMLPVIELFNPPEISAAIVRTQEYLQISNYHYPEIFDGKPLSAQFESLTGITLERFLQMIIGVYASLITNELDELIQKPEKFNIRKSEYFQNLNYSENEIDNFFKLTSIKFEALNLELENSPLRTTLQMQYDFTVFRKYPLFHLSEDILTFTDFTFLIEKASVGFYYTILNLLQGNNIYIKTFSQHWGLVFEKYVNNIFRGIYPLLSNRFHPNTFYESKQQIEAFDGIVEYPTALVFMQYKGGLLNAKAKYSGNVDILLDEMNDKFGTKKNKSGINQLVINIERLFNKDITKRSTIRNLKFPNTRVVYPMLIVNELSMGFGLAHWKLREWFDKAIASKSISADITVNSLMILTIEDLEMLEPYLYAEDFTLLDFAQFYSTLEYLKFAWLSIRDHWFEPMTSMREVFHKFRESRKIEFRPNQKRQDKFDDFMDIIKSSFKNFS